MKKYKLFSSVFLVLIFILVGCSPKGDPSQALNSYYENIKNKKSEDSYEILSKVSKENIGKDDFTKWHNLQMQTYELKEVTIKKLDEYKNKELDGIKYKNAIEFNVTENIHDNYNDKDINQDYKRYVVNEDGVWTVYKEKTDIKKDIAESMTKLAQMYYDGKGKNEDLNNAASILNEALTISKDYPHSSYLLGTTLSKLGRYDESITNIQEYLNKINDDKEKSNAYNVLGVDYEFKKDYVKAKEYYNQAIELDSNNQYAKTNLERTNKLIKLGL